MAKVAVLMGSDSDWAVMQTAIFSTVFCSFGPISWIKASRLLFLPVYAGKDDFIL